MDNNDFVHLHSHSHYSLLRSLPTVGELVEGAKEKGYDTVSLTDFGSLYGAIEFYKKCKEENMKPIIGFEAFVAPDSRYNEDYSENETTYYHLVLLAENFDGYQNLMKLSSTGHLEGRYKEIPRIDKDLLREYSDNLIALSGPIEGEVSALLNEDKKEQAKEAALEYQEIFGKDNFYLELQDHPGIEGQMQVNTQLEELSEETGIPMVVSRDVRYLDPDQTEAQDILRCIDEGWKMDQKNREDYRHVDRSMNEAEDIISRFKHVPEAVKNTRKIADRVEIEIELDNWHFAPAEEVGVPEDVPAKDYLRREVYDRVFDTYEDITPEIIGRIEYELAIIEIKGYSPYFLCVADYVQFARDRGIVETTRGSAAGSLVSYILDITIVDPVRFQLPFERFLNPYRPSAPDIDTDFADDRRDEVIRYLFDTYGEDRVAQIITFGTMKARGSVRDVGRVLGYSYNYCDEVAKLIPMGADDIPEALEEEPELKELYEENEKITRLLDLAMQIEGRARHTSIHAAGVVISPTDITDFTPVQLETDGDNVISQYEMHSVESAGVLKYDVLGIRNLSILGNAVDMVEETTGDEIDIYNIPYDDEETYEMLADGHTVGVFQLAGTGMTRWVKEMEPERIQDIMALVALYRPGPMEFIPEYIKRKENPEHIEYPHPQLKDVLEQSYGLLIYQEDVMLTAIKLAGYDWEEADKFRKAMGKKIPELMEKQEKKFMEGCEKNGIDRSIAKDLWERIKPFAEYAFNKSHASSYGVVAYQTAYMKANYPVQYMTAILQAESGNEDKVASVIRECEKMDIEVLPPDINESYKNFTMVSEPGEPGQIRFGLNAIKNVGDNICEIICQEREKNGGFKNLEDFLERVHDRDLNKTALECLAMTGAMDCFEYNRNTLLQNVKNMQNYNKKAEEKKRTDQGSLFSAADMDIDSEVKLDEVDPASMDQKLKWEKELLGLYLSSHPFKNYQNQLKNELTPLEEMEEYPDDEWVVTGGIIDECDKKITKNNNPMMFATIQDTTGKMEYLAFPQAYEKTKKHWEEENMVVVVGRTPEDGGDDKIFAQKVYELRDDNIDEVKRKLKYNQKSNDSSESSSNSKKNSSSKQNKNSKSSNKTKTNKQTSKSNNTKSNNSKKIKIALTKQELKKKMTELKQFFEQTESGSYQVYLKVGRKTIKANSKIKKQEEIIQQLEAIVGENKINFN
jgi:DNA polymerase-3 subunit alpha